MVLNSNGFISILSTKGAAIPPRLTVVEVGVSLPKNDEGSLAAIEGLFPVCERHDSVARR